MITTNSTTVTASHRISPTGFGPIALTVGEGSMAMIHPSRGLTPPANASGRNWLPGRRRRQSWQNPVIFDLTRDVEEVDGAANIRMRACRFCDLWLSVI
jgi:hypothetical protein